MRGADKKGVASVICLLLAVLPPFENWKQPVDALLIFASFALAFSAGRSGRRAWFAVCALLVALLGWAMFYAMKSL